MARRKVIGIYGSIARARLVQEALIAEGTPEDRVSISVDMTLDGIAAEAPGQSYANQPGSRGANVGWLGSRRRPPEADPRANGRLDASHCGSCVVTVEALNAGEVERICEIMKVLRPLQMDTPT